MAKHRMKVTIIGYYWADEKYYAGQTDPQAMANIDMDNIESDLVDPYSILDDEDLTATIEPTGETQ